MNFNSSFYILCTENSQNKSKSKQNSHNRTFIKLVLPWEFFKKWYIRWYVAVDDIFFLNEDSVYSNVSLAYYKNLYIISNIHVMNALDFQKNYEPPYLFRLTLRNLLITRAHDSPRPAEFHAMPRKVCCYRRKMPRRGNVKYCNVFRDTVT
jgi:hypothetical protein